MSSWTRWLVACNQKTHIDMLDTPLILALLACALYGLIVLLLCFPLAIDASVSRFELARRNRAGLASAAAMNRWNAAVPALRVIRLIAVTLLAVAAVNLLLMTREGAIVLVTIIVIAAVPFTLLIVSFGPLQRLGAWAESKLQKRLLGVAERSSPATRLVTRKEANKSDRSSEQPRVHSLDELLDVVDHSRELHSDEVALLRNAVAFSRGVAASLMIPRPNIETVESRETLGPVVLTRMHQSSQEWFVVIERGGSIDQPLGVLHLPRLRDVGDKSGPKTAKAAMSRSIGHIEPDTPLRELLQRPEEVFIVVETLDGASGGTQRTLGIVPADAIRHALLGASASA